MNKDFPKKISVFPLRGAIFFPKTNLPLNIFEKRYVSMVEDALKGNKYIGMVQSKKVEGEVFKVGCLGKIDRHEKTPDGRILINLNGLSRFKIDEEVKNDEHDENIITTKYLSYVSITLLLKFILFYIFIYFFIIKKL